MPKHIVEVYRDGKWWMADIAALDILTQERRIANIEHAAREAIALTLNVDPLDFDLACRYVISAQSSDSRTNVHTSFSTAKSR